MKDYKELFEDNQEFLTNRTGKNLQGNIMQSHGRRYVAFLTLHWEDDDSSASPALKKYLSRLATVPANNPGRISITSAADQHNDRRKYNSSSASPQLFIGIYLTYQGFEFLRKEDEYNAIYKHLKDDNLRADMDRKSWSGKMKNIPQMMIMLAHSSESFLKQRAKYFKRIFISQFEALENSFIEYGQVYRNRYGRPMEHFGYADGIGQPWFLSKIGNDFPEEGQWDPIRDIKEFLVEETPTGKKCYGSFLAYRKFEQDVKAFMEEANKRGQQENITPEKAGAKMLGRFVDGSPVVNYDDPVAVKKELDKREVYLFNYKKDEEGNKCPYSAHIRKMNNRIDPKGTMIIRRGVAYGKRSVKTNGEFVPNDTPSKDVGLHFLSFQKSFETFNNLLPTPNSNTAPDAVLGDLKNGFVKMKGGSNYYAPSIKFFKDLVKE